METETAKPDCVDEEELSEMLEYLDDLREDGATNMFGAGEYLRDDFGMDRRDASAVLSYWMTTFGDRHPA